MVNVLVVDDDLGTLETVGLLLRTEHYGVVTARTGERGLALVRDDTDVALVDLRLPDMSGLHFIRRLRERVEAEVSVVIMTGFGTAASAVEAMKLGAADYIEKPLIGDDVVNLVRSATRKNQVLAGQGVQVSDRYVTISSGSGHPGDRVPIPQHADARVARTLDCLDQRSGESCLTSRLLAHEFGVSHEHLCRLIKLHTGCSFRTLLQRVRVLKARRLLGETSLSVKQIAAAVGYTRTSQLDQNFKRHFAVTPTDFRRRFRDETFITHRTVDL